MEGTYLTAAIIYMKQLIPDNQFGFRSKHATVDQIHHITDVIEKFIEEEETCLSIFLEIAQAFNTVCHGELLMKLRACLPVQYVQLLES